MSSVTFPVALGGDGNTYSDDASPTTGLANGGHKTRFIPTLSNTVAMAQTAKANADAAATSAGNAATSAAGAAGAAAAAVGAHEGQASGAHAASAVSTTGIAGLAGGSPSTVQAVLAELKSYADGVNFPSGTRMLFQQTAAPTGWTKATTFNDAVLRVVSGAAGSGGADAFSTAFGAGKSTAGHAIAIAEMPSHNHAGSSADSAGSHQHTAAGTGGGNYGGFFSGNPGNPVAPTLVTDAAGAHSHSLSIASQGSGAAHSHTLNNMNLRYADVIVAQKD